jgi:pimeloyl-ACP methyl ester carboxylesterase
MHRLIQGSELIVLDNAGHYSYADQFNAFRLRVNKFLRSDHPNGHFS